MARRLPATIALTAGVVAASLLPTWSASATSALRVVSRVSGTISTSMPVIRLHFSTDVRAAKLPPLTVRPALSTRWQQIGPRDVQAVVVGRLRPLVRYTIDVPSAVACRSRCSFQGLHAVSASSATSVAWEQQLLATLHYLPLTFTPRAVPASPADPTPGTYTWDYANLPAGLSAQWRQGFPNILLTGALMSFQSDHNLAATGVADATTWNDLVSAVEKGRNDPHPYAYVLVSTTQPEHLTLYVAGRVTFRTLVNTGISVAPTALGTYPVYLRYVSATMSGTNPDGSHYSDPGIPWISYFNGGDALHGFLRSTYGWPQSLGCVEMTYDAAKTVWPFTPIGTLVTVV
jgi:L,D-transpeptidase catalytic domain